MPDIKPLGEKTSETPGVTRITPASGQPADRRQFCPLCRLITGWASDSRVGRALMGGGFIARFLPRFDPKDGDGGRPFEHVTNDYRLRR